MNGRYRVASGYEAAYPEPLTAARGTALETHDRDSEWPGWVWCTGATGGAGGWVPRAWLKDGVLVRDYTARELTVAPGELVTASFTESGWAWVTNGRGHSGWVPLRHLAPER